MRRQFKYLFIGVVLITSCDSKLDIKPEDTLVETDVFAEEALAERALGEAYLKLVRSTTNTTFTYGDFTTDVAVTNNIEFYNNYIDGNVRPDDQSLSGFWLDYYSAVNSANALVVNIPKYGAYDQNIQDQHIGEAKFIRAFAYLKLLNLFGEGALTKNMSGLGLPMPLTPFEGYNEKDAVLPRSSVQEVYDQIIKDLEEAAVAVPESYGTSSSGNLDTRTRATKGAAYALLSRTYLYMGDYPKAADYAQQVINLNGIYELDDDLTNLFPNNFPDPQTSISPEYIFGYPFSSNQMGSNNLGFSYFYKLSIWVNEDFIATYPAGDLRVDQLIFIGDTQYNKQVVAGRRTTVKFSNPNGRSNVPMLRLAEVILTRAEALARTNGVNQESVDLLNEIYKRANPTATDHVLADFGNGQQLVDEILKERKFELAYEGQTRYDLIRTGRSLKNPNIPENYKVLPIPQIDIDIGKGIIIQNPGY
ncbi:MAG TPA: RagB/SusD family nutrient uptake outer membrane protein [Fulvivirga sp.]|nr:RagB/SusD family nutrient uptake outer membrane protein [Fulvivirga sp.]